MKRWLLKIIDRLVNRCAPELRITYASLEYLIERRAVLKCLDYIFERMPHAERMPDRNAMYRYTMERINPTGSLLEFGVATGRSINYLARLTDRVIHGFDSFTGLPDDGRLPTGDSKWYPGKMDQQGALPETESNVVLHPGWFDQTIDPFIAENPGPIALLHIDCDIYSSTKTVFDKLRPHFEVGTYIIFDELLGYVGWQAHEARAFDEMLASHPFEYEFQAYTLRGQAVARVTQVG